MAKIKVIYKNQTSGEVDDSFLDDLIVRGEIVAYCGYTGWSGVKNERISGKTKEQKGSDEKGVRL
jgi:hypothetical protein